MARITDDVIWEILLNLPAESILLCRKVCKSWLKMIPNPVFIKARLEKAGRIVVPGRDRTTLYSVVFDSLENLNIASVEKLDYPLCDRKMLVNLVGTCNGLICLENTNIPADDFVSPDDDRSFTLWNPSTGIHRIVADKSTILPSTRSWNGSYCYFGYGHVVRVTNTLVDGFILDVYRLKTDSWRKIHKLEKEWIINVESGVLISGTLYPMASKKSKEYEFDYHHIIVEFDIATASLRLVELPPPLQGLSMSFDYYILGEVQCRLSMMGHPSLIPEINHHCVWLLEDDPDRGNKESWWWKSIEMKTSKPLGFANLLPYTIAGELFTQGQMRWGCDFKTEKTEGIFPMANLLPYTIAGEQVLGLFRGGHMKWCDLKTKKTKGIGVQIRSEYLLHQPFDYLTERKACVCLKTIASPFIA